MTSPYSGSLTAKRKAELVEIAQALDIPDADAKISELVKKIQQHLDMNETSLSKSPMFKGLYNKKKTHADSETDTPLSDAKAAVVSTVVKGRKSINKAIDKVVDAAANIPLPETPVNAAKISEVANQSMAVALAPAKNLSGELSTTLSGWGHSVVKYTGQGQRRVDVVVRAIRDGLSTPEHIVLAAISLELVALFFHVVQFYDHTIWFPPPPGSKGTVASLLHSAFGWAPSLQVKVRWPDVHSFKRSGELYSAVVWWFFSTVLPPLTLSTVVSFVPQKGVSKTGHNTRHAAAHPPSPTVDPLSFSIFRLALLVFPLTTAAPSAMVDALEMSGNLQGRALGAGLLAGLMLADRLGGF
ncbi:hypothetical protein TREMEDRAFT_44531 [Tremella mesenterica DSM 1558]|uniref:uncharacterized protein n=1 Tax=Tremella mesenterica (strain ATCC 24925 / CBS 8224 / DSM 1558 / NBRC 9311 / NRRL Y-6157 / RJB 2259-6 / UBC 559-6) TaxID=578456 RepID=UPI0003F48C65|nr:uncharacterized protein TREMEDRAFT_44531 [Tremella mesenterica DSM 1558]EIW68709.1 hypothetical protein TREMEDRAFT_44531 [Tremella mesenterica DSM 1558]